MWDSARGYKYRSSTRTRHAEQQSKAKAKGEVSGFRCNRSKKEEEDSLFWMKMRCIIYFVALLSCCCGVPTPRPRPRPLDNSDTWNNIMVMAKHAQAHDRDHETRLIPKIASENLKAGEVCCVNVKILNYYLSHILHGDQEHVPRLHLVKPDLRRVARDLEPHCNSNKADLAHFHSFTKNLKNAGELYKNNSTAQNKAIGETDILFHYLYESCTAIRVA